MQSAAARRAEGRPVGGLAAPRDILVLRLLYVTCYLPPRNTYCNSLWAKAVRHLDMSKEEFDVFERISHRNQKQQRQQRQRGSCCILEIRRAELLEQPNSNFDWRSPLGWLATGRPDLQVNWTHGPTSGNTQVQTADG